MPRVEKLLWSLREIVGLEKLYSDYGQDKCCRYFESVESVLSLQELDAIYIASTPVKHLEIITEAAKQNIHILCDKPLATNLYDADEILSAAEKSGITLMVPFNPRFQLPVIRLKTMIRNGSIGNVLYINAVKYGKTYPGLM